MAVTTLHVRKVETLPNGDYSLQVSCPFAFYPAFGKPFGESKLFERVRLPARTKNVERLLDSVFVNESAGVWLATHGGEWDDELVREYLECILEN
jgi:hypothetical protein